MNIASLEISKKLYEVSGWETDGWLWTNGPNPAEESYVSKADKLKYRHDDTFVPAYSAGYLLRKLPANTLLYQFSNTGEWCSVYASVALEKADTPEDALALLCIKLIEEKILSKGV